MQNNELRRLAELIGAMHEIAEEYPDLEVWASSAPPPFTVRARLLMGLGSGVEMWITAWGATLRRWPPHDAVADASSFEERNLRLDLKHGYEWEDLVLPNARVFARVLVQRMMGELTWKREQSHDYTH